MHSDLILVCFSHGYPADLSFFIVDSPDHDLTIIVGPQYAAFFLVYEKADRSLSLIKPAFGLAEADSVFSVMLLKKGLQLQV